MSILKNIISKINIKKVISLTIGLVLLFIPVFFDFLKTPTDFNFNNNLNEQIFVLPEDNNVVLNFLEKATKSIDITIYLLSDRKVIEKLKKLNKNGISIRILLERKPFGGGSINYNTFNELSKTNIKIKYSNPDFTLTHAKYIIIDQKEVFIMTSNLTYSGLNNDRDFIFYTSDKNITIELNNIFENDFNYKKYKPKIDNLIISPDNSRIKIEGIINSAKKSIYIYAENINDSSFENLIIKKAKEGVKIKIILPDSKKLKDNIPKINKFKEYGIEIYNLKKPYQHSKILIIDENIMYIGSINFSYQSLDTNREVGIVSLDSNSINKILKVFNDDFNK